MTLYGPGGGQLLKVDSLTAVGGPWPAEEIHWVAESPGEYRLAVALRDGPAGPCPLRLEAQRTATAADRARTLAETALARGHALRLSDERRCREGVAPYRLAERQFRVLGLAPRRAEALLGLGFLYRNCLHENGAALRPFVQALPLFPRDGEAEATVRQQMGEAHFALGDLDTAIAEYRRTLELRQRSANRAGAGLTANNLGLALHLRGHYDEAAALFDLALVLRGASGRPGDRAQTLLNRGKLHLDLGETERARRCFEEALGLFRQTADHAGLAATLNALGHLALEEGHPGAALAPLTEALVLRQPDSRGRAVTLETLGVAYGRLDRREEARRVYVEAQPIFLRLGDTRELARCLSNLGWLEADLGHDDLALGDFDRALGHFATLGDPPQLAWTLRGKAEVLRRRGQLEAAHQVMEEALSAVERHRLSQQSDTTRTDFFATQQSSYDFLIDLLMELHRKSPRAGYDAQALGVGERALARSLLDALAAAGTDLRSGAAPGLLAEERRMEEEVDALVARQNQLARDGDATSQQRRRVDDELDRGWENLDRVRAVLRTGNPRYAALTQPQPSTARQIQRRLLDPDTLLLEYRLGEKRSFLWAVTPDSLAAFELPGRAHLTDLVKRAGRYLAASQAPKAEISAELLLPELSTVLLGPVAHLLPGKRLLVVGDGVLQTLPFAALPEPRGGDPLVAHHEIVTLPSVSVLGVLRQEAAGRKPAPRALWVLADPDFAGSSFPPLPDSRREAAAIQAVVPAGESTVVLGRAASRDAVLHGPLSDYRILHFATHNSFAATEPGGGRMILAQIDAGGRAVPNGFLRLGDVYGLNLRADLVVLSACQSALGREVRGEGLVGMTRGFFYAGAQRVLVSLWNVNDEVTVDLMRLFYRGMLEQGLSPAAALRAAQDAIRRQKRWRSPYYWAGFALQGEWRGLGNKP